MLTGRDHNRILEKSYVILLAFLIVLQTMTASVFALENTSYGISSAADPGRISSADWMSALPDETLITDLNIPGAHDAASYILGSHTPGISAFAEAQDHYIFDPKNSGNGLLDLGVRYLDLSYCLDENGDLSLCSGMYKSRIQNSSSGAYETLTNDLLMRNIKSFLGSHKKEALVLEVRVDSGGIAAADALYDFFSKQAKEPDKAYPSVYTGKRMPTLGEARGKVVILIHPDPQSTGSIYGRGYRDYSVDDNGSQWAFTVSDPEDSEGDEEGSEAPSLCVREFRYSVYYRANSSDISPEYKKSSVAAAMDSASAVQDKERDAGRSSWVITDCSANGFPDTSRTIRSYSDAVNPYVKNRLSEDGHRFYGCLLLDNIDGDLSRAVWSTNFGRSLLPVSYNWYYLSGVLYCSAVKGAAGASPSRTTVRAKLQKTVDQPSCDADGTAIYAADFSGSSARDWAETQTKTVSLPADGHDFGGFAESSDGNSITVLCSNEDCPLHDGLSTVLIAPDKEFDGEDYDLAYLFNWDEFSAFVRTGLKKKYGTEPEITVDGPFIRRAADHSAASSDNTAGCEAIAKVTISCGNEFKKEFTLNTSFDILKKSLTVSEIYVKDKVYDGTTKAAARDSIRVKGLLASDEDSAADVRAGRIEFENADAGSNKTVSISAYGFTGSSSSLNGSYSFSPASQSRASADIFKRPVKITASDQTVSAGEEIETGAEYIVPESQKSSRGLLDGHIITDITLRADASLGIIKPSRAKIVDSHGNDVTGNYRIEYLNGQLDIAGDNHAGDNQAGDGHAAAAGSGQYSAYTAPSVKEGLVYNGKGQTLLTGGENIIYCTDPSDIESITADCSDITGLHAGSYTIWWKPASKASASELTASNASASNASGSNSSASNSSASNSSASNSSGSNSSASNTSALKASASNAYSGSGWHALTAVIKARPLSIAPDSNVYTKTYGSDDPEFGYTIIAGSIANGDQICGSLSRETGEAVGSYNITIGSLGSENPDYDITFEGQSVLTVERRKVTIGSVVAAEKIYDGTDTAAADISGSVIHGKLSGDDVFVAADGRFSSAGAGIRSVKFDSVSLGGSDAGNYELVYDQPQLVSSSVIRKRPVIVTAKNQTVSGENDIDDSLYNASLESFNSREQRGAVKGHCLATVDFTDGRSLGSLNGSAADIISVSNAIICDRDGNDVTSNYDITYADGRLTQIIDPIIERPEKLFIEYDGESHPLIRPGAAAAGYMLQYSLSENGPWSSEVPSAKDAGAHDVWYRVIKDDHLSAAGSVSTGNYGSLGSSVGSGSSYSSGSSIGSGSSYSSYSSGSSGSTGSSGSSGSSVGSGSSYSSGSSGSSGSAGSSGSSGSSVGSGSSYSSDSSCSSGSSVGSGSSGSSDSSVGSGSSAGSRNVSVYRHTLDSPEKIDSSVTQRIADLHWENSYFLYDGINHKPSATVANLIAGDKCTVTVEGGAYSLGVYTATATGLSDSNYMLSGVYSNTSYEFVIGDENTIASGSASSGNTSDSSALDGSDSFSTADNNGFDSSGNAGAADKNAGKNTTANNTAGTNTAGSKTAGSDSGKSGNNTYNKSGSSNKNIDIKTADSSDKTSDIRSAVNTADHNYLMLWYIIMASAVIDLCLLLIIRLRKIKENKR